MPLHSSTDTLDQQQILDALKRLSGGDLTVQLPSGQTGTSGEIAAVFNQHVHMLNLFASELTRISREMGPESKYGGQMEVPTASGTWKDLIDNVNLMGGTITNQFRRAARQITDIAMGNLSNQMTVETAGEMDELKQTLNIMADQFNTMTAEITRIAREIGADGRYGGQAQVRGVSGFWKNMVDEVNTMAASVTDQVRDVRDSANASATSVDKARRISAPASGEMAALQKAVNGLIERTAASA